MIICNTTNILFYLLNNLIIWLEFKIWVDSVSNQRKFNNSNHCDVASLVEDYCSLIIWASQFSSTTRNLVLRIKRWSKGERSGYEILTNPIGLGCSSQSSWSFSFMSLFLFFRSSWSQDPSSGTPAYLRKNRGVSRKNGALQGWLSGRQHQGKWRKVTLELKLKNISRAK